MAATFDVGADLQPLRRSSRRSLPRAWWLALCDAAVFVSAFWLGRITNWIAYGYDPYTAFMGWRIETGDQRVIVYAAVALAAIASFYRLGHYTRRRTFWQELGDVLAVVFIMALIETALIFMLRINLSRLWFVTNWSLLFLSIPFCRWALKSALHAAGLWCRTTVIVGTGANARDAAAALHVEPLLGYDVVAFIAPPGSHGDWPVTVNTGDGHVPVYPPGDYPNLLPAHFTNAHVVVALELDEFQNAGPWIQRLSHASRDVDVVSPVRGLPVASAEITHFFSHDVLSLRLKNNLAQPSARLLKRTFDLAGASALLAALSPLFLIIAWRIRRQGQEPFFAHERVGQHGRRFQCLKFRTMVEDADEKLEQFLAQDLRSAAEWHGDRKLKEDPRVTPVGRWLRQTSLDELPQLWNVLRGDMSLVGPRPVVADELARYEDKVIFYLGCRPGITGLWQVSGRSDLDYRRRVHLDSWYVRNWRLWYDIVILLKTLPVPWTRDGAY